MIGKIKSVKRILKGNKFIEFAYLFGSQAKSTADEKSDWDIAIYFKKYPQKLPQWTIFYLESEISGEIGKEVQIISLNNLDSPVFLFQIIKNGLLLVDKNTEKRILFESKVLSKYHDWKYFLRRHTGMQ
ncbi:MAG: nucleotidyltransferase domain-containing protein [Nitrospirae bacterium]|nr:nucleotidyltransferase domain-containing protein [Nitrospirota bacterium]